jgi:hypothetical protein
MELIDIQKAIRTQDNRATGNPIFAVQQRRRIWGMDPNYTDEVCYVSDEDPEVVICSDDPNERKAFRELEERHWKGDDDGWSRSGFKDEWEFVQPFFTEKGAEDYIRRNGHNLKEPRIFVYGGYRNIEWGTIRRFLLHDNNNSGEESFNNQNKD